MAEEINYYILFANYTQGLALQELLKSEGLRARIAPTPRAVQGELSCGMSLLVLPEEIDAVRECIARHNAPHHSIVPLPCQIRPGRGRFC
ncbi:MAG: DUF3343 domain-containing protein [Clostridia bacterium]|nr:DUF3343 domain-containing protein [Clostridia bacterium]MBR6575405.1 DUF3343 domain-containing protein [Clostridia bacterium]